MTASGLLLRPDPGVPTNPYATTADRDEHGAPAWLQALDAIPVNAWLTLAAVIVALVAIRAIRIHRRTPKQKNETPRTGGGHLDKVLTFFAASVATGVVGTGMWAFFRDTLHIDDARMRALLFAFFEVGMLAEALRSRLFRLDRARRAEEDRKKAENDPTYKPAADHEVDADGIAVWVLALLSGFFAASHETEMGAIGLRLVAPIIAAWLWERGIAGELRQFRRTKRRRINWTITPERILARLHLAEANGRDVTEVDRAHRISQFAETVYRLHRLREDKVWQPRITFAEWQRRRQLLALNEHLNLAMDRGVMAEVRTHLATLYQADEGVRPEAVRSLSPWAEQPEPIRVTATTGPAVDLGSHLSVDIRTATLSGGAAGSQQRPAVSARPVRVAGLTEVRAANPAGNLTADRPANPAENRTAKPFAEAVENPAAVVRAKLTAKPIADLEPLGEKARVTVDKLARAFARKPNGTNAELAKLARVSKGTADRYMPRVRAEAAALEAATAGEAANAPESSPERTSANGAAAALTAAATPLAVLPLLPTPSAPVMSGVNGHSLAAPTSPEEDPR